MPARNATGPRRLTLRAYNVGFGDCLLLSFEYAGGEARHVLVDCGTRRLPPGAKPGHMRAVVADILRVTGRRLDGLVVTHRHLDHTSALDTEVEGATLRGVARRVVEPWTEDPALTDADLDAGTPRGRRVAAWRALHDAVGPVVAPPRRLSTKAAPGSLAARLGDVPAVRALRSLARINRPPAARPRGGASTARYVKAGDPTGLEDALPGVALRVIGPAPPEARDAIDAYAKRSDEYWLRAGAERGFWEAQGEAAAGGEEVEPFPDAECFAPAEVPAHVRWFMRRVDEAAAEEALAVVRAVDDALNNTSVMLLVEVGAATLLLPGDAQLEAWRCARALDGVEEALGRVTVYKVGHHGSRNATPKSAWRAIARRGARRGKGALVAILSSRRGVHVGDGGEVPRRTLVKALREGSTLVETEARGGLCTKVAVTPDGRASIEE